MITLTYTAQITKRVMVVGAVFLIAYLVLPPVIENMRNQAFAPAPPPPEVAFGNLPKLGIPTLPLKEGVTPNYEVDTQNGRLPTNIPDRLKVYKTVVPQPTPLSGERAKNLAVKLGFTGELQKLSASDYFWRDSEKKQTLKINVPTGNFTLDTNVNYLSSLEPGSPPSKATALEKAKEVLTNLGILTQDYIDGRKETVYLRIEGESVVMVQSLSEAQLTRVDFYREVEDQPILGQNPYEGLIQVTLSEKETPFIDFYSWNMEADQGSTYSLKTPTEAWNVLKSGQGRIVYLGPIKGDPYQSYEPAAPETIFVREIYTAYYDSEKYQEYIQPIYVFEGLGMTANKEELKFIAYVPAVASSLITETHKP